MHDAQKSEYADGVYFGLDEEIYHGLPFLSASGIKRLLVSPTDYWACSNWNPLRIEEKSDALLEGKAYHKRILEGLDLYERFYAAQFQAEEGWLDTCDDLREALAKAGIKPKGTKKADLIDQVQSAGLLERIVAVEAEVYAKWHEGKSFLRREVMESIELSASMIEHHPEIRKCFTGGYPEVTVLWTEDDIRFKARFDYLKTRAISDLKTFANQMSKPVDRAVYFAMASNKYHVQATLYLQAAEIAKRLVKEGRVFGPKPPEKWLQEFQSSEPHGFYFVFQQKGPAPLARGYKFPRHSMYQIGEVCIAEGIRRFKENLERFGTGMWVDCTPVQTFDDDHFPAFATEM